MPESAELGAVPWQSQVMQTFLPYADFKKSARVLDDKRLGKQRVEALQVVRAITYETYGWQHHPATKMWRGYQHALICYGITICIEWRITRGYKDSVADQLYELARDERGKPYVVMAQFALERARLLPPWLGNEDLHRSHRSNLYFKQPGWYGMMFHNEIENGDLSTDQREPYVWPVR